MTAALRAAGDDTDMFKELTAILERHNAITWGFQLLDLCVELSQQDLERACERRTYHWPESGP